jgi:hypothetical protein
MPVISSNTRILGPTRDFIKASPILHKIHAALVIIIHEPVIFTRSSSGNRSRISGGR